MPYFVVVYANSDKSCSHYGVLCKVIQKTNGLIVSHNEISKSYCTLTIKGLLVVNILNKDNSNNTIFESYVKSIEMCKKTSIDDCVNIITEVKNLFETYFNSKNININNSYKKIYEIDPFNYSLYMVTKIPKLNSDIKNKLICSNSLKERLIIIKQVLNEKIKEIDDVFDTKSNKINLLNYSLHKDYENKLNYNSLDNYKYNKPNISRNINQISSKKEVYINRVNNSKMHNEAKEIALSELNKINSNLMIPGNTEDQMTYNYIETLLSLPWEEYSDDNYTINKAKLILDRDHYGLQEVKERILEFLSVKKLVKNSCNIDNTSNNIDKKALISKGSIICFNGPPGVGKTSLAKSIAEALNRKFCRISLGGVRDEAAIRGHRRTYVASMPGNIINGIKKVKSSNPLILLDEIDKVGSYSDLNKGNNVESALLELLDPEQNETFKDNFLNTYYDLSKVLFICTSNDINYISAPLKDRLEIINISSYSVLEKIEISKRYLIPKQVKLNGIIYLKDIIEFFVIPDEVIKFIIEKYTFESGVRGLEKQIEAICRYIVKEYMIKHEDNNLNKAVSEEITKDQSKVKCNINKSENVKNSKSTANTLSIDIFNFIKNKTLNITEDIVLNILGKSYDKINIIERTGVPGVSIVSHNIK